MLNYESCVKLQPHFSCGIHCKRMANCAEPHVNAALVYIRKTGGGGGMMGTQRVKRGPLLNPCPRAFERCMSFTSLICALPLMKRALDFSRNRFLPGAMVSLPPVHRPVAPSASCRKLKRLRNMHAMLRASRSMRACAPSGV